MAGLSQYLAVLFLAPAHLGGEVGFDTVCLPYLWTRQKGQKQGTKMRPSGCRARAQVAFWNSGSMTSVPW